MLFVKWDPKSYKLSPLLSPMYVLWSMELKFYHEGFGQDYCHVEVRSFVQFYFVLCNESNCALGTHCIPPLHIGCILYH